MVKFSISLRQSRASPTALPTLLPLSPGERTASVENKEEPINKQYVGKEHFRPLYDNLLYKILKFGKDIEITPKNSYVSLKRKRQFAILQPVTKTRFEIGLNLKGQEPEGILEPITATNAMCSHKIILTTGMEITPETP